jgi:hypothetical protein
MCRATIRAALASAGVYLLFAIACTYPLILHLNAGVLRGIDTLDALQQSWVLAWVQHALLAHPTTLFNAPIFYPRPNALTFQDSLLAIGALMLPLSGVVHNPLVTYNLAVLISYPLCGLSMYALALHLTGDRRAAFLAGLIFAFCPYRERHVEHLNLLSAEGIPLLILGFELARARGGALRWCGFGVALALCTASCVYYAAFTMLALACYAAFLALARKPVLLPGAWRGIWAFCLALVPVATLLLPYLRTQHAMGGQRRLQDVVYFSADVRDYLHAGPQNLLYGWSDALWRIAPLDVRQYLFPGWVALALAIVAVVRLRRPRLPAALRETDPARRYLAMAALLAVLALGPYLRLFGFFTRLPLPYLAIYSFVPGLQGLRDVGRYDQVAMAFLAVAAAFGAARLFALFSASRAWPALAVLGTLAALEYATVQPPLYPVASGGAIPAVYRWLAAAPPGALAELPMCRLPGVSYCSEESTYMYFSAYHWHPLLNGGGGFFPSDWDAETAAIDRFPARAAVAALLRQGARYVVVHPNYPQFGAVRALLREDASSVAVGPYRLAVHRFGGDLVFVLPSGDANG